MYLPFHKIPSISKVHHAGKEDPQRSSFPYTEVGEDKTILVLVLGYFAILFMACIRLFSFHDKLFNFLIIAESLNYVGRIGYAQTMACFILVLRSRIFFFRISSAYQKEAET
jgi:hypothetical protein